MPKSSVKSPKKKAKEARELMRNVRQDEERRKLEQEADTEARSLARLDPKRRNKEQEANTSAHYLTRQDPKRRNKEQEANTSAHFLTRQDPKRRNKEQETNTSAHFLTRQDPKRRNKEQEANTSAHFHTRQDLKRRKKEQEANTSAHSFTRQHAERRKREQKANTAAHARARRSPTRKETEKQRDTIQTRKRRVAAKSSYHVLLENYYAKIRQAPTFVCSCCGGLWYIDSTSVVTRESLLAKGLTRDDVKSILHVPQETHRLCSTCKKSVSHKAVPKMCLANGFDFSPIAAPLMDLSPLEERLVALRLPFMQIRAVGSERQSTLRGNVVNVENDLDVVAQVLPRRFDETSTVQVQLMRRMVYQVPYMYETIRPLKVFQAAQYLVSSELYKAENVLLSDAWSRNQEADTLAFVCDEPQESLNPEVANEAEEEDEEREATAEETLIFSEQDVINQWRVRIAPAEGNTPLSLIRDLNAEVLSFPSIYGGGARAFKEGLKVSYTDIAKSEVRRYDRRASKPGKILYSFKRSFNEKVVQAIHVCLRQRTSDSNVTAANARDPIFLQNLISRDDGYAVFKNLRSSPAYWKEKTKKVLAMIRQLGKPALFITLSAAETKWPELLVALHKVLKDEEISEADVKNFSYDEISDLIRSDPVTCMRNFDHRFRALLNNLLKPAAGIFHPNQLLDYFTRIEFQMRGSPHSHGLYWIEGAPEYKEGDENSEKLCVDFIDNFITCERHQEGSAEEFIQYQIHKHSHTCKKKLKGGQTCRFGFPQPPMDVSRILSPLPESCIRTHRERAVKDYDRIKQVLESMGRTFDVIIPFDEFLESLSLTHENYIIALRTSIKRTTVFLKRFTNSIYVNAYNPKLLGAWGANLDIQFILDTYACAKYCVSYILKSEGGLSKLLRAASADIRRGNTGTQEKLRKFGNILINGSEVSAQEASAFLLGIPNTMSSKTDVYVNTAPPAERVSMLKSIEELEDQMDTDTDVFQKGLLDHYIARPRELENCCLAEFASMYDFSKKETFRMTAVHEDQSEVRTQERETGAAVLMLLDASGYVKRRKVRKIIRYRHYGRAQDPENYHRERLMLFLPWRDEEKELLSGNSIDNAEARADEIKENSTPFIHNQDVHERLLQDLVQEAEDTEFYNDDNIPLVDEDLEGIEVEAQFATDIQEELSTYKSSRVEQFLPPKMVDKETYVQIMRSLNDKQRRFVLETLHRVKCDDLSFHNFLSGGAGVGKSHVITAIVQSMMRYHEKIPTSNPEEICVLVSAPTGKAAFNVFGMTLHCSFKLPPTQYGGKLANLDDGAVNSLRTKLKGVKLFIIDEISMVSVRQFYDINQRLLQIFASTEDFGGKSLLVVGHLRQLPPIGGSFVFTEPRHLPLGSCTGNYLWKKFSLFELDEIMRQKGDYAFCKALNNMAEGCMDEDDIALLKSREITEFNVPPKEAIHLFHTNAQCAVFNAATHASLGTEGVLSEAYDKIQGRGSLEEKQNLKEYAKTFTLQQSDGLPSKTHLQVGGEYFVSTNINVGDGLFNGSTGSLKQIIFGLTPSQERVPIGAYMDFRNPLIGIQARASRRPTPGTYIDPSWTPIFRVERNLSKTRSHKGMEVIRKGIPLIAANGTTIAKSQGSSHVCVAACVTGHKGRKLTRELIYVACSRATSSGGLYIDGRFEPPAAPSPNDLVTLEMERLRMIPFTFRLMFLQDYDDSYQKIYYHNVQSLHAHYLDVIADQCAMGSNVIALVEPHLLASDNYSIPEFSTVHRINCRVSRNSEGSVVFVRSSCVSNYNDFKHHTFNANGGHCLFTTWKTSDITTISSYKSPTYPAPFFVTKFKNLLKEIQGKILTFGDGNIDLKSSNGTNLKKAFENHGLISALPETARTTDGGSQIDFCFSNISGIEVATYESYYSYHKPICIAWKLT